MRAPQENAREETAKGREVADELFGARAHFVPNRIEDAAHDHVEGAEVRVVDREVVQVELPRVRFNIELRNA